MNYLLICLLQRCFGLLCSFAGLSVFVWVWVDSWFWVDLFTCVGFVWLVRLAIAVCVDVLGVCLILLDACVYVC